MTKVLVSLASMVVIAIGGYWLVLQYDHQKQAEAASRLATARASCLEILDRQMAPGTSTSDTEFLTRDCVERGLLYAADINARR
jgi:hypothetical protein